MASHQLHESSAPPASPTAAIAAGMLPPSIVADSEPQLEPKDGKPSIPPAVAVDGDVEALARPADADGDVEALARPAAADGDVEALARPAARAGADRPWLRRIKIKLPSCSFHCVFNCMARTGNIVGSAYRRSFVACYISKSSALCVRSYQRSFVPCYVTRVSALCACSWDAVGVVFNPLPPGSQLLPVSDPTLISERLSFTPDMERLHLVVLAAFVVGAVVFISLEILVVAGVVTRYDQYCAILKFVFKILQRLLVAFNKASGFYNNVEWFRMEMARERHQLPPPVGDQQRLPPPAAEQHQLPPPVAKQQLPPPVTEKQQQQLPPPPVEQLLPTALPPEMDIC